MPDYCIPRQRVEKLKKIFSQLNAKNKMGELVSIIEKGKGTELFSKQLPKEEAILLNKAFEKAIASQKATALATLLRKNLDLEYRNKLQMKVIENFFKENKITPQRVSVPIKDILKMPNSKRLAFLKEMMPEGKAIELNNKLIAKQATSLERELADKLTNFNGIADFNRFLERRMDYYAGIKEGVELSDNEIGKIMDATSEVSRAKQAFQDSPTEVNQMKYGEARLNLLETLKEIRSGEKMSIKETVLSFMGIQRAVQLGIDFSTTLIQGGGMLTEKSFWNSVKQGFKNSLSKEEERKMVAQIMGDPLFDKAKKAGLRLPVASTELYQKEEAALFNKIPFLKNNPIVKGSNAVLSFFERYVSSLSQARFNIWKEMYNSAKLAGSELTDKELKILSDTVNTISGASSLGRFEKNTPEANILLISARLLASRLKMIATPAKLLTHYTKKLAGKTTIAEEIVAKKQLRSFLGIVGAVSGMISLSKNSGYEVETDPTSSNFAKMKVGKRYIDLSLGYGTYIRSIAQIIKGEKKTEEGIVQKLRPLTEEEKKTEVVARNSKGKELNRGDVLVSFIRGKLAALPSVVWDVLTNETYSGKKPTIKGEIKDKFLPLFAQDFWDIIQDESIDDSFKSVLLPLTALGISGYTREPIDWTTKDTKEFNELKKKIGDEGVKKLGVEYENKVKPIIEQIINTEEFKRLSNKEKADKLKAIRYKIKQQVISKYK